MSEKPNILIVDDEEIVRRSYSRVLSGAHCETKSVVDGDEALRAMARESFDVVLLDLRMPGQDGITVLRAIKEHWPESEVVVITGYPTIETAKEAVRLGAWDYLAKPVDPDEVIHATRGAVLRKRWALRTERGGEEACAGPTQASAAQVCGMAC
jgi:DNA-binding NtrC family response regulator